MSKSNEKSGDLPRGLIGRKGTPTGKSARLPSIRTPRDLTLGGIPKKTFVPNIPVRRDKTQQETSPLVASTSQDNKDRNKKPERGRGQGRGRGRGAANIVQSHSIFEQGPTQQIKQREERERTERVSTAGSSRGGVKREKPESEETKRVIDDLLRDDFIDDAHVNTSDDMPPIYLPLSIPKNEIKAEDEVKVKQESMDTTDAVCTPETQRVFTPTPSASEVREKMTCDRLFMDPTKSDVGEMVFVQLPDVLPGIPPTAEDDTARKSTEANKSTQGSSDTLKLCKLADFSEGHIGKLRVRASGKTELILGNIVLDMNMGTPCAFLQDVVCVRTGGQEGDNLSVLAHVTNKVVCTPNFELLLS